MKSKKFKSPDFIGIGTMKAASSWIFYNLKKHPEICGAKRKEVHFFDRHKYKKGLKFYSKFFKHCDENKTKGEFTPSYIYAKEAPSRIYDNLPEVKIIACLRNPVDRAYSEYRFSIEKKEKLRWYSGFLTALQKDKTFREKGFYYKQLKKYFNLFPKKNMKIMIFDDLKRDPSGFIKELYSFLGVKDTDFTPKDLSKKNVTGTRKIKHKIPLINSFLYWVRLKVRKDGCLDSFFKKTGIKDWLRRIVKNNKKAVLTDNPELKNKKLTKKERKQVYNIYKDDINKLEKLIKRDLSFWKIK